MTKVRLACLQLEAQEKSQSRQAQLQLEVKRMEIEADKAVRIRQLELEAQRSSPSQTAVSTSPTSSPIAPFDVGKHIALVPPFREAEADAYLSTFERVASALQ